MKTTTEHVLSEDLIRTLYPTYVEAWEHLLVQAAARHVLTFDEFTDEMTDPRIEKHVVWDDDGTKIVALTTLTTDMSAIPWINAQYFEARYPDAVGRGALFYLGYTLVDQHFRRSNALLIMAEHVNRRLVAAHGVVGFDICDFNNEQGIGRRAARLLSASTSIEPLDTQTYYAADFRGATGRRTQRYSGVARSAPAPAKDEYRVVTLADRPDLAQEMSALVAAGLPTFLTEGRSSHSVDVDELLLGTPERQMLLLSQDDVLSGVGIAIPLHWNGSAEDLPLGSDDALRRSAEMLERGQLADSICMLSLTVAPHATAIDPGMQILRGMLAAATATGAESLLVPVRPEAKASYPLTPIERYAGWQTRSGEPFDPMLRLHRAAGAEVLRIAEESSTVTGSVEEWQDWVDMDLPESGAYVIPGGHAVLEVDLATNSGRYVEPHIWVRHKLGAARDVS